MIKIIYTFFIGLLVAIFIGVGISVFYPEPGWPQEPNFVRYGYSEPELTQEQQAELEAYNQEVDKFHEEKEKPYNRNASIIVMVAAIVLLGAAVSTTEKAGFISDGLLLGGVFTLFYAMMRGLTADSDMFRFGVVTVCLVVALALGYWKFKDKIVETSTKKD